MAFTVGGVQKRYMFFDERWWKTKTNQKKKKKAKKNKILVRYSSNIQAVTRISETTSCVNENGATTWLEPAIVSRREQLLGRNGWRGGGAGGVGLFTNTKKKRKNVFLFGSIWGRYLSKRNMICFVCFTSFLLSLPPPRPQVHPSLRCLWPRHLRWNRSPRVRFFFRLFFFFPPTDISCLLSSRGGWWGGGGGWIPKGCN